MRGTSACSGTPTACGSTYSTAPPGRSISCVTARDRPRRWPRSWPRATRGTRGRRGRTWSAWWSSWWSSASSPGADASGGGVGARALVEQAQDLQPEVVELQGLHQAEVRPRVVHLLDVVLLREGRDGQDLDVP